MEMLGDSAGRNSTSPPKNVSERLVSDFEPRLNRAGTALGSIGHFDGARDVLAQEGPLAGLSLKRCRHTARTSGSSVQTVDSVVMRTATLLPAATDTHPSERPIRARNTKRHDAVRLDEGVASR